MISVWLTLIGVSIGVVGYAYLGYPLLLAGLAMVRPRPIRPDGPSEWPLISITLPVYNEQAAIGDTLTSLLEVDYPPEKRQIVVISDASTDRTDAIVAEFAGRGVELVRLPKRGGKTAAENAARSCLRGEIVVQTDASVRIHPAALKPLIASFTDPSVGVASGRDVSIARPGHNANLGETGYVGYEMWVRDLETRVGGIIGASGCFYASRLDLHMVFVPEALSRDFAAPLIAHEHGFRSVSVPDAVCYVPRASSLRQEYRRKVRTMARGLETLCFKRRLLNPLRYGAFAWMLFSHKLARWLVPWAVLLAAVGVGMLAITVLWARWLLGAGAIVAALGVVGWLWPSGRSVPGILALPAYLCLGLVAGLHAWVKALTGEPIATWEPTRRDAPNVG